MTRERRVKCWSTYLWRTVARGFRRNGAVPGSGRPGRPTLSYIVPPTASTWYLLARGLLQALRVRDVLRSHQIVTTRLTTRNASVPPTPSLLGHTSV